MPTLERSHDVKVADEVFIATALLHREHPDRADFTISEIVDRVRQENIYGEVRPGVVVHASLHCVANKQPNPGRYRMLYATGTSTRRLLRSDDEVHPLRNGKILPSPEDVPPQYRPLIDWAKEQYGEQTIPWLGGILGIQGLGKQIWNGDDPDEYVARLREDWV